MDAAGSVSERVLTTARNLKVDHVTREVVKAFTAAGIEYILLKGPSIARWLYDEPGERPYSDTDLLVPLDQIDAAEALLARLGFEHEPLDDIPGDKPWHAHAWIRPEDGANVDLHRTLIGVRISTEELWPRLVAETESIPIGDEDVPVLRPHARAFHLALHAAQDGLLLVQSRADLHRAWDRLDRDVWDDAAGLAKQLDAESAFATGLRLIGAQGEKLLAELGLTTEGDLETAIRSGDSPDGALGLWWLRQTPGVLPKIRFLGRKLVPSPEFMRAWTPLGRKGRLGLTISYLYRLAWLATIAPRAVAHYAQAKRKVRHSKAREDNAERPTRFTVLGVEIDDLDHDRALARIEQMIAVGTPGYVAFCTVSTVVTAGDDPELMTALEGASLVTPDGMPLVWLGKRAGLDTQRVYGPDFLVDVLKRTGGRYRHFFYGGAPGVAEQMVTELRKRFPDIEIAGTASPPFVDTLDDATAWGLEAVAATSPDIVWVGLGHPKQEKWMRLHHGSLGAPVVAGVGAAFDFLSGQKKEAPRWMKRSGLQWLHRLLDEPGRLWRRYLLGNAVFITRFAKERRSSRRERFRSRAQARGDSNAETPE